MTETYPLNAISFVICRATRIFQLRSITIIYICTDFCKEIHNIAAKTVLK
jgi:hypothetical protein